MSDKMNEVGQELIDQMMDCNSGNTKPTIEKEKQSLGKKPPTRSHTYGAEQLFAIGRYVANKMRDPYAQLEMMPTRLLLIERLRNAGIYRNHLSGLYVNPSCDTSGGSGLINSSSNVMGPSFRGSTTFSTGYNKERHQHYKQYQQHQQYHQQQQQQHQLQQQQQLQQLHQLQELHQLQLVQQQQLQQLQLQQQQQEQQKQQQQQHQQQFDETKNAGDGDANRFY